MRIVIQEVSEASVSIEGTIKSSIQQGSLILSGIGEDGTEDDIERLVKKVVNLRVFDGEQEVMNKSILDVNGNVLVVSQFTLMASYKKGNRLSYIRAAGHEISISFYQLFCERLAAQLGKEVATGESGADMQMKLVNDGSITICTDTRDKE